jgi:predicted DNA-binding antitoxin AbrB/MazE fold protein
MDEVITAVYENGVLRPLEEVQWDDHQTVSLHVLSPEVRVPAAVARRKVSRFVLDEISYLLGGEQPSLIREECLYWRVPVTLSFPSHGRVGTVGTIDVNAESGDLMITATIIDEITENARILAARYTPNTETGL